MEAEELRQTWIKLSNATNQTIGNETLYQHIDEEIETDTFNIPCNKYDKTFKDAESKLQHFMDVHCSKGSVCSNDFCLCSLMCYEEE